MAAAIRNRMAKAPPLAPVPPRAQLTQEQWDWLRELRGIINVGAPPAYLFANLPSPVAGSNPPLIDPPLEGQPAFCLNGRKVGEGAGLGTGVPVYWSNGLWRVFSTDAAVTV